MEKEKSIQTIQQICADFGKGNVEGILNALTDDITWSDPGYPDIPYAANRTGKNEVINFFKEMSSTISFTKFVPQELYADNDAVIVKGFFAGKANSSGKTFETDWVMIWKFRGAKVFSYQAFVDTGKMGLTASLSISNAQQKTSPTISKTKSLSGWNYTHSDNVQNSFAKLNLINISKFN